MKYGILAGVAFWAVVAAWGFWGWLGMVAAGVAAGCWLLRREMR